MKLIFYFLLFLLSDSITNLNHKSTITFLASVCPALYFLKGRFNLPMVTNFTYFILILRPNSMLAIKSSWRIKASASHLLKVDPLKCILVDGKDKFLVLSFLKLVFDATDVVICHYLILIVGAFLEVAGVSEELRCFIYGSAAINGWRFWSRWLLKTLFWCCHFSQLSFITRLCWCSV